MADLFDLSDGITMGGVQTKTEQVMAEKDNFLSLENKKALDINKEVDWVFTHRKTEYLQKILALSSHKSVSVRRKIVGGLINIADKDIIRSLQLWKENEPDRQVWLGLEILIDKLERGLNIESDATVLSVSEALSTIKQVIGDKTYTIEGELSEVKEVHSMVYFSLKDKQDSRLNCWAYSGILRQLNFPLNEGLQVRITGNFKLSKDARVYLDVKKIQLTGEGELARNLKLLEEKLTREGLFDVDRKRPLPKLPQNVLLIASLNSAALDDYLKVMNQRRGGVNIWLLPIKTQGVSAEFGILEELSKVNDLSQKYNIDTVVLTRGGGSKDDLFVFNSEKIVRALYAINRPLIVAIGHERDNTLAELVADLRCSTPSQAAEKTSLSLNEVSSMNAHIVTEVDREVRQKLGQYKLFKTQILQVTGVYLQRQIGEARQITQSIPQTMNLIINEIRKTLYEVQKAFSEAKNQVNEYKSETKFVFNNIVNLSKNYLLETKNIVSLYSEKLSAVDPKKILAQGYALVWQQGQGGELEVVDSVQRFDKNKTTKIEWEDGKVEL